MGFRAGLASGHSNSSTMQICLCLLAAAVLLAFPVTKKAMAECAVAADGPGVIAGSTCDCNYWQSLESHAWLTAEREVVQNQNLIFKADSVLEYTCFDKFLDVTAGPIARLFSETQQWGMVRPETATDNALQAGVNAALISYLGANFGHTFLGGRVPDDYEPDDVSGGSYFCDRLAVVWQLAKCYNFATRPHDGFFSFENYRDTPDKRELPDPCVKDGRWPMQLNLALRETMWDHLAQRPINRAMHEMISEFLAPGACTGPQPTGVQILPVLQGRPGPDAFCTNPGCVYKGGSCSP